jgi:hypothetical protein
MKTEDKAALGAMTAVVVCLAANRFLPDIAMRSTAKAKARRMRKAGYTNFDISMAAQRTHDVYLDREAYK